MSYFTERHGMRAPIDRTEIITIEMYSMLFDCCTKYYDNIAWKYPEECPDGNGCCGLDYEKFSVAMTFEIPKLYRNNNGRIEKPRQNIFDDDVEYDQYALLDLIELMATQAKDISNRYRHSFYHHDDLTFSETRGIAREFRNEINDIFMKTGLQYSLAVSGMIERVAENSPLSQRIEAKIAQVSEKGLRELLRDAVLLYKTPRPEARKDAVEKIWDAFERLKTCHTNLDKKRCVEKIVNDMAGNRTEYVTLFENEFKALTAIGNDFRIRHHEMSKTDIVDNRHYDYFFNRCLTTIALALEYLP